MIVIIAILVQIAQAVVPVSKYPVILCSEDPDALQAVTKACKKAGIINCNIVMGTDVPAQTAGLFLNDQRTSKWRCSNPPTSETQPAVSCSTKNNIIVIHSTDMDVLTRDIANAFAPESLCAWTYHPGFTWYVNIILYYY